MWLSKTKTKQCVLQKGKENNTWWSGRQAQEPDSRFEYQLSHLSAK